MPGLGAIPYIVGRKPKAPAGVVRSPSRFWSETPRCPSHAAQGPAAARQQPPFLRQSRSVPFVDVLRGATTVTSCVAEPVEASWLASVVGQTALACSPPAADAAAQRATAVGASHRIAFRLCGDGGLVRRSRADPAAVRAFRRACDRRATPLLVAPRLSGRAVAPPTRAYEVLGLRPPRARGRARRQRLRRQRRRSGFQPVVFRTVSDPSNAADRRVRRDR